ncbi:MAG: redoxin family protein [Polyangiaceae bacterium]
MKLLPIARSVMTSFVLVTAGCAVASLTSAPSEAQPARKAWLGVEMSNRNDGGKGVLAKHVIRTSPAEKAGLRDGDAIVKVEGKEVGRPADVISVVQTKAPGDGVDVIFARGTTETKARVTLGVFPDAGEMLKLDKLNTFAPSITSLQSIQGSTPLDISQLKGKVVLLDFWAGWCGVCRATTPVVNAWAAKYGAQGLAVIGVSSDSVTTAQKATGAFGIEYTVGADVNGDVFKAYGVSALPTMFVIDKGGVIRNLTVGLDNATAKDIENNIVSLLAATP